MTGWELLWELKWYIVGMLILLLLSPIFYGIKSIGIGVMSGGSILLSTTKNYFFAAPSIQRIEQ